MKSFTREALSVAHTARKEGSRVSIRGQSWAAKWGTRNMGFLNLFKSEHFLAFF